MYIIELIFKLKEKFAGFKQKRFASISKDFSNRQKADFSGEFEEDLEAEYEKCEHLFRPVDSTNTVLACVKCGYLIHCSEDEFKRKNIFEDNLPE